MRQQPSDHCLPIGPMLCRLMCVGCCGAQCIVITHVTWFLCQSLSRSESRISEWRCAAKSHPLFSLCVWSWESSPIVDQIWKCLEFFSMFNVRESWWKIKEYLIMLNFSHLAGEKKHLCYFAANLCSFSSFFTRTCARSKLISTLRYCFLFIIF